MKTHSYLMGLALTVILASCVSSKKYASLKSDFSQASEARKSCEASQEKLEAANADLARKNQELSAQIDYLKKNNGQVLTALEDMSVLTSKQAESMKQSLKTLSEKDAYIRDLQTAIRRKDSLNLNLVMNLKSSLSDINDRDINIKVEKGVVYVDLSDKLLFNSGQYTVTQKAKGVLGKIAAILNAHPDLDVMVEGHTDSVPIHNAALADNWDLSVKRATSVVRILEHDYRIDPVRLTAAGHGKYIPVSTNNTAEGRALNRRTRIMILPQLDQFFKLMVKNS